MDAEEEAYKLRIPDRFIAPAGLDRDEVRVDCPQSVGVLEVLVEVAVKLGTLAVRFVPEGVPVGDDGAVSLGARQGDVQSPWAIDGASEKAQVAFAITADEREDDRGAFPALKRVDGVYRHGFTCFERVGECIADTGDLGCVGCDHADFVGIEFVE